MLDGYTFELCLTHDVDRPYKGFRGFYYALRGRPLYHLRTTVRRSNPYWQFDDVMALEEDLGVRSAFYFLTEPPLWEKPPSRWLDPAAWVQHVGRYDVGDPDIAEAIRKLDRGGWEVGLHGSYDSFDDPHRLAYEKSELEAVLDGPVRGCRQHYLRLAIPETWRHHRRVGLRYDATLGSGDDWGFDHGYRPKRPFDDTFVVFPLTLMEQALPDPGRDFRPAWEACRSLLDEAAENDAVMTVLWHPRYFSTDDFPGYRRLYRRIVERANDMGAWVGPPIDLYDRVAETA